VCCAQLTLGRAQGGQELRELSSLYATWNSGFLGWPWVDIPLTPFWFALRARRRLVAAFQAAVDEARGALAAGRAARGLLDAMVAAEDADGNRCVTRVTRCARVRRGACAAHRSRAGRQADVSAARPGAHELRCQRVQPIHTCAACAPHHTRAG
jgi:hypothetical protein